jgi:hypothetical protein
MEHKASNPLVASLARRSTHTMVSNWCKEYSAGVAMLKEGGVRWNGQFDQGRTRRVRGEEDHGDK